MGSATHNSTSPLASEGRDDALYNFEASASMGQQLTNDLFLSSGSTGSHDSHHCRLAEANIVDQRTRSGTNIAA